MKATASKRDSGVRAALENDAYRIAVDAIFVPKHENVRSDLPRLQALKASLEKRGQLQPLGVVAGGPDGFSHTLVYGFRRMAAIQALGWERVLVVVRPEADAVGQAADNIAENEEREEVHVVDLAARIADIASGRLSAAEGEEPKPMSSKEVAARLGMPKPQVNKLLHLHAAVPKGIRDQARKEKAPTRLLIRISATKGEERQQELLDEWVKTQDALARAGRKRAVRGSRKESEGDGGPRVALPASKRVAGGVSVQRLLEVLRGKKGVRFEGMVEVLRFLTGDKKTLDGVPKSELQPEEEAEG